MPVSPAAKQMGHETGGVALIVLCSAGTGRENNGSVIFSKTLRPAGASSGQDWTRYSSCVIVGGPSGPRSNHRERCLEGFLFSADGRIPLSGTLMSETPRVMFMGC